MLLKKDENQVVTIVTILLLEDDETMSEITTDMLGDLGYTVETVTRGEDAVTLYRTRKEEGMPFTAVILDMYQPKGIGGVEAAKRLLEYDAGVIIIGSSGLTDDKTMVDPEAYGFRASLPKPYNIVKLCSVLESAVSCSREE